MDRPTFSRICTADDAHDFTVRSDLYLFAQRILR
jgi:hypothetical protein